ncbi:MAG: hypothetical protein MRY74_11105 [Neomegalonema sp.]|nr:hypothetical protein [Neomegalonema sp.]
MSTAQFALEFLEANSGSVAKAGQFSFLFSTPRTQSTRFSEERALMILPTLLGKSDGADAFLAEHSRLANEYPEGAIHILRQDDAYPGAAFQHLERAGQTLPEFIDSAFRYKENRSTGPKVNKELRLKELRRPARFVPLAPGEPVPSIENMIGTMDGAENELLTELAAALPQYEAVQAAAGGADLRPGNARLSLVLGPAGMGKSTLFKAFGRGVHDSFLEAKARKSIFSARPLLIPDTLDTAAKVSRSANAFEAILESDVAAEGRVSANGLEWLLRNGFATLLLDGVDEFYAHDVEIFDTLAQIVTMPGSRAQIFLFMRDVLLAQNPRILQALRLLRRDQLSIYALAPWTRDDAIAIANDLLGEQNAIRIKDTIRNVRTKATEIVSGVTGQPEKSAIEHTIDGVEDAPMLQQMLRTPWSCRSTIEFYRDNAYFPPSDFNVMGYLCHALIKRELGKIHSDLDGLVTHEEMLELRELVEQIGTGRAEMVDKVIAAVSAPLPGAMQQATKKIRRQVDLERELYLKGDVVDAMPALRLRLILQRIAHIAQTKTPTAGLQPIALAQAPQSIDAIVRDFFTTRDSAAKDDDGAGNWRKLENALLRPTSHRSAEELDALVYAIGKCAFFSQSEEEQKIRFTKESVADYLAGAEIARRLIGGRPQVGDIGSRRCMRESKSMMLLSTVHYCRENENQIADSLIQIVDGYNALRAYLGEEHAQPLSALNFDEIFAMGGLIKGLRPNWRRQD